MKKDKDTFKELNLISYLEIGFIMLWIVLILPFLTIYHAFSDGSVTKNKYLKSMTDKLVSKIK